MNLTWLLFSFKGRISRKPFWIYYASVLILWTIYSQVVGAHFLMKDSKAIPFNVVFAWPTVAVLVKRWHDRNKSGLWIFINAIPVVGSIWALIETGILEGTQGSNRFGTDPLEGCAKRIDINQKLSARQIAFALAFTILLISAITILLAISIKNDKTDGIKTQQIHPADRE